MKSSISINDVNEVDREILRILQEDGKATLSTIAVKLAKFLKKKGKKPIGKTAIQGRIKHLRQNEIIEKFMAVINCKKIGYKEMLLASLRLTGSAKEIGEKVKEIEEIKYIYITSGEYPLFVMAKCFDHKDSIEIVDKLHKIPGVEEVKTEIVMDCIKEDHSIHI